MTNRMTVSRLEPGQAFRVSLGPSGYIDYRLVYKTNGGAYVESMKKTKKKIVHADEFADLTGETTAVTEIVAGDGRTTISLGTECEPIETENDFDHLCGDPPKTTRAKTREPNAEKRELKEGSKRARVVTMLAAGHTFKKVCAELGINRGCALSHLSDARKFNGVQYEITGDTAKVRV